MHSLNFKYNHYGHGHLELLQDGEVLRYWEARTGSIKPNGELVNAIPVGVWTGIEQPVDTAESAMVVQGIGWKFRLWTPEGKWSHYLIHPDGGLPGSAGCIVLVGTVGIPLRERLKAIIKEQKSINVTVTQGEAS